MTGDRTDDRRHTVSDPAHDGSSPDRRAGPVARFDQRHNVLWLGSTPLPFRPGIDRNGELIQLVGAVIRGLRGLEEHEPCPLRRSESRVLAGLLDLDDPDLRRLLRHHLGLTKREAGDTVNRFRRSLAEQAVEVA